MGEVFPELLQVALPLWLVVRNVERNLLPRRIVQEDAGRAHQSDRLFEQPKTLLHIRRNPRAVRGRIALNRDTLTLMRERLPYLFSEKRHERMQEPHGGL